MHVRLISEEIRLYVIRMVNSKSTYFDSQSLVEIHYYEKADPDLRTIEIM